MNLFNQYSFMGGLNTRLDTTKLPVESYSLLSNGRITRNTVKPVKKHVKQNIPSGNKQGLYSFGKYLILFSDGVAWWRDASTGSAWSVIPGWTAMDASVSRIYTTLIPVSYFLGSIEYPGNDAQSASIAYDNSGLPAPVASQLFVADGVNPNRVINFDGTWREVNNNVSLWTPANPEYVPIGVLPKRSGSKLYLMDPATKTKIYQSVSGRFLDFIINRQGDGAFGGDEQTTFKSVDFNPVTGLSPTSNGGLIISTLYATYGLDPDYNFTIFGEPYLRETLLFPTGAVNDHCYADILGDTAFVTQEGIQAFNITAQTQTESNNYPLGAPISEILIQPQTNPAAVNFDTYALFSVETTYGNVVLVYDNTIKAFVSIDNTFGEVIDFAPVKYEGTRRLFFLNSVGDVYEAYAGDGYAVTRVYLGDFTKLDAGNKHRVKRVNLMFGEVSGDFDVQLRIVNDGKLAYSECRTVACETYPENGVNPLPYVNKQDTIGVNFGVLSAGYALKSGLYLEWSGPAQLISASVDGDTEAHDSFILPVRSNPAFVLTAFADNALGPELATGAAWETITGLTIGDYYTLYGEAHIGDQVISNRLFRAKGAEVSVNLASLQNAGSAKTIWDKMLTEAPLYVIGAGDHAMSSGSKRAVQRILNIVDKSKLIWVPGNHDLDTDGGKWFYQAVPTARYYKHSVGNVDIFALTSGYRTGDILVFPNTEDSAQGLWLKEQLATSTARFKLVVLHHPPYTDDSSYYPGYTALRWPFASWGASMVISGHSHFYQRFYVDDIPYIVLGPAGSGVRSAKPGVKNSQFNSSTEGYLKLYVEPYSILIEWKDSTGAVLDATSLQG